MNIFLSCGETSGDRYAAELIKALQKTNKNITCFGNGGEFMKEVGAKLLFNVVDKSTIGFIEPFAKIPYFLYVLNQTKRCIQREQMSLVIIIDHQGFNIPLAKWCQSKGVPVVSVIAPQFWMLGNIKSAKTFVNYCTQIFCIFKREFEFYKQFDQNKVTYVGHPLIHMLPKRCRSHEPIIGLFPGSRPQEVKYCLPIMLNVMDQLLEIYPTIQFELAIASDKLKPIVMKYLRHRPIKTTTDSRSLIASATVSLVASGTVSLEHAIIGTPCIVMYQFSKLSYLIASSIVLKKLQEHCDGFMALPNILARKEVCPEFLQSKANPTNILDALKVLLEDDYATKEIDLDYRQIQSDLTNDKFPFETIANAIIEAH